MASYSKKLHAEIGWFAKRTKTAFQKYGRVLMKLGTVTESSWESKRSMICFKMYTRT